MIGSTTRLGVAALTIAVLVSAPAGSARAGLALTPAGISAGFTLSNYATGGPGTYRFLAAAPLSDGNLAVVDYAAGNIVKYADVDGQTLGSALATKALGSVVNIVRLNGVTYASQLSAGLNSVDSALNLAAVGVGGYTFGYGLAANQSNSRLYSASNSNGIYAVDPIGGTSSLVSGSAGRFFDGISISPDGKTVYGASGDSVFGYSVATGAQVFSFSTGGRGPDGTGVISGGTYNGYVIINNNDGTVQLVDPTGTSSVIIASGGTRGDFTSPDSNDGSLLLSEYGDMWRLKAPQGTFTATPEPSTMVGAGIAAAGMILVRLRRRRAV